MIKCGHASAEFVARCEKAGVAIERVLECRRVVKKPRGFSSVRASDLDATITNARDELSAARRRVG